MINLNQNQAYSTKPLLRLGFRPFFFASGVIAVASMLMWIVFYQFSVSVNNVSSSQWHAHEMIYAYAAAVAVGFLLTASKNWTGIQTLYGKPLLALLVVWIAGRFLAFIPSQYLAYQAVIDSGFLFLSSVAITYTIIKGKNWSNFPIIAKLILLAAAHITYYLGVLGWLEKGIDIGIYAGFYLIISLLFMMARKLLPFFIERGLNLNIELKNSKFLDLSSLFLFLIFIVTEVFFQTIISNILAAALFVIHALKMFNWYHVKIWQKPLLWSIYLAYGLLTLGFALNAISSVVTLMPNMDIHSFAFGIALMTLSMMARVSLGHTGRNVFQPPKQANLMFILLTLAFIVRVFLVAIFPEYYANLIFISQLLWILSFSGFVIIYTPMFFQARLDGQFG